MSRDAISDLCLSIGDVVSSFGTNPFCDLPALQLVTPFFFDQIDHSQCFFVSVFVPGTSTLSFLLLSGLSVEC